MQKPNSSLQISLLTTLLIFGVPLVSSVGQESKKPAISEIASGTGSTEEAAIQDAMKNAVQQALGAFAESKETVKDGKYTEKIVVNGNGIIQEYDLLGVQKTGSEFRVTILAQVQSSGIVQELKVREIPVKSGATEVFVDLSKKRDNRLFERNRIERGSELLKQALKKRPNLLATTKASIIDIKEKDIPNRFGGKSDKFEIHVEFEYQYDWTTWLRYNVWLDSVLRKSRLAVSSKTVEYTHDVFVHELKGYYGRSDLGFFVPADSEFCKAHVRRGTQNDFLYTIALLVDYQFDPKTKKAKTKWVMHKVEDQIWQKAWLTEPELPPRGNKDNPVWRVSGKRYRFSLADQMITTAYGKARIKKGNIGSRTFKVDTTLSNRYDYCEFSPLEHTGSTPNQSDTFFLPYRDKQIIEVHVDDTKKKVDTPQSDRGGRSGRGSQSGRGGQSGRGRPLGRGIDPIPVKWNSKVELRWRSGEPFFGIPQKLDPVLPNPKFPKRQK